MDNPKVPANVKQSRVAVQICQVSCRHALHHIFMGIKTSFQTELPYAWCCLQSTNFAVSEMVILVQTGEEGCCNGENCSEAGGVLKLTPNLTDMQLATALAVSLCCTLHAALLFFPSACSITTFRLSSKTVALQNGLRRG